MNEKLTPLFSLRFEIISIYLLCGSL